MRYFLMFIIIVTLSHVMHGQNSEVFHEIELGTELWDNEDWHLDGVAHWKHLYNDPSWRRFGIDAVINRGIGLWTMQGGFNSYYTFNSKIDNFLELRPWLGVGLKTPISHRLDFVQRVKGEWRTFHYAGDSANDDYARLRYKMGFDIVLSENEENHKAWKLLADVEFYFLKDPASGERFANTREYALKVLRELPNRREIAFGYKIEEYSQLLHENEEDGHIIFVEYKF